MADTIAWREPFPAFLIRQTRYTLVAILLLSVFICLTLALAAVVIHFPLRWIYGPVIPWIEIANKTARTAIVLETTISIGCLIMTCLNLASPTTYTLSQAGLVFAPSGKQILPSELQHITIQSNNAGGATLKVTYLRKEKPKTFDVAMPPSINLNRLRQLISELGLD